MKINFANNLRALIKNNGYSQERFAKKFGTSQSLINGYVNKKNAPNLITLCDIAAFFNVSLDELVYGVIVCNK